MNTEIYLLATLLYWPDEIAEVSSILKPEDFALQRHQEIYAALQDMVSKGKAVEGISLIEHLRASGRLEAAGGEDFLARDLCDLIPPSSVTAKDHAKIVRDLAIRRFLQRDALAILEASQDPTRPIEEIAGIAERAAVSATARTIERGAVRAGTLLGKVFESLQNQSTGVITGLKTGFIDLDQHLNGLQKKDLIILGGRPAMGKTSLALDIAGNVSIDFKEPVAFFELEMGREQIVERLLLSRARVNGQLLRKGLLPQRDFPRLSIAVGPINDAPLYIDDAVGQTPLQIQSKCRQIRSLAGGLSLVVIDNIQIMRGDGKYNGDRRKELADVSNNLKRLAKELEVPVIVISHLNRKCEERADHEPTLSDLKETGDIEQDADIVMLLYREEVYQDVEDDKRGEAKVILAKYRNGESVAKIIRFHPEFASFSNWSGRQDDSPGIRRHQDPDDFMRGIDGN